MNDSSDSGEWEFSGSPLTFAHSYRFLSGGGAFERNELNQRWKIPLGKVITNTCSGSGKWPRTTPVREAGATTCTLAIWGRGGAEGKYVD